MLDQANNLRELLKNHNIQTAVGSSRVITVTSGKGGVGKSNFSVNMGLCMAKLGKRVILMDVDFGLSNVEVLLGIVPKYSLSDVLFGQRTIDEVLTPAPLGVKFISGGSGLVDMANMTDNQMGYIIDNLVQLDSMSDIIIIDTGAGISKAVLNFIRAANETIIITTPEPTSITDAYAIIKTLNDQRHDYFGQYKLIVNRVDDSKEGHDVFTKLDRVTKRFLDISLEFQGAIPNDKAMPRAVRQQSPLMLSYPNSEAAKAIERITESLLNVNVPNTQTLTGFMKKLSGLFTKR
jgi:flagellar biosynthesis protein FlhG